MLSLWLEMYYNTYHQSEPGPWDPGKRDWTNEQETVGMLQNCLVEGIRSRYRKGCGDKGPVPRRGTLLYEAKSG